MDKKRFFSYILPPSIILAGAILRFINIGRESLWFDELFTVWVGSLPLKDLIAEGTASGHPQLYNLITYFWLSLGSNDVWLRMISFISGVVTIGFVYLLGKEFASRRAGLWAAALAAVSPFLYYYSREATDKGLSIAAASASLYFFIRSMNRGGWGNWTAYILATATLLFAHFYGSFLVAGEVIFYFVAYDRKHLRFREWLVTQFGLGIVVILWYLSNRGSSRWVSFQVPDPFTIVKDVLLKGPAALMGFILPLNHGDVYLLGTRYVFYPVLAVGLFGLVGLMFYSREFRTRIIDRKIIALSLLILVVIAGPVVGQVIRDTFTSIRYFAWGIVPFLLLLAVLINAMPRKLGAIVGTIAIVGSLGITGWSMQTYRYDDWRGIMSTISSQQQTGDRLLCFPLSECTMAAHHYLPDGPIFRGGYINDEDSVKTYPAGIVWTGYDTNNTYGSPEIIAGEVLKARLDFDIDGAERVWVLGGDGSVARIKRAEAVYEILAPDWRVERQMSYPPYLLKLYVRNGETGQ